MSIIKNSPETTEFAVNLVNIIRATDSSRPEAYILTDENAIDLLAGILTMVGNSK